MVERIVAQAFYTAPVSDPKKGTTQSHGTDPMPGRRPPGRSKQIQIYFLPAFFFLASVAPPCVACAAFLAVFSCRALASLSRRCSGVSPSSRPLVAGFRACALCLSRSLWSPRATRQVKDNRIDPNPKHTEEPKRITNSLQELTTSIQGLKESLRREFCSWRRI